MQTRTTVGCQLPVSVMPTRFTYLINFKHILELKNKNRSLLLEAEDYGQAQS